MKDRIEIRNHSAFNGSLVTASRIASMLQSMEPEDIAAELGQPWPKLKALLEKAGVKAASGRWAGRNRRTWQIITAMTERGVYVKAQIKGWSDWEYVDPKSIGGATQ